MLTNEPWRDEDRRQQALEDHMSMFPVCASCGHSLMNFETVIYLDGKYYCDKCAIIHTNDEMREAEGLN